MNPVEPLEIEIPTSSNTVSKLVNSFQSNELDSPSKTPSIQIEHVSSLDNRQTLHAPH